MYAAQHAAGRRPRLQLTLALLLVLLLAVAGISLSAVLAKPAQPALSQFRLAGDTARARPADVMAVIRPGRIQAAARPALPVTVSVRHGDSLSALSELHYGTGRYWYFLAVVNHITSHPDTIRVGQHLWFPAHPRYIKPPTRVVTTASRSNSRGSSVGASGPWPGGAFGACVVARESGGNAQIMNSSGHYGLYQFSFGTWKAYGGSAALFGHASVAYQEQIFMNALRAGGQSNWSPYDGC